MDSGGLASLRRSGQVAGAAGFRNRQSTPMFLHLIIEPEKCVPFQFLPVKSAQAAKFGGLLDSTATGNCPNRLRVPKPPPLTDCLGSQIVVAQISFVTECWDNIEPFSELLCCG